MPRWNPEDIYELTVRPHLAEPTYLQISFQKGVPVKLNQQTYPLLEVINQLNKLVGADGVGQINHMENRLVGIKSREIYECPAATGF